MKKGLVSLLIFALVFTMVVPALAATGLTDIDNSYAKEKIEALIEAGIIDGYQDGTFKPDNPITRAEFAKIIALAAGLEEDADAASVFTDVPAWAAGYVGALVNSQLTNGLSETRFGSNENITRQELAVFFVRAWGLEESAEESSLEIKFNDASSVAAWAKAQVALAGEIEFILGNPNGNFDPTGNAERQAVARLAYEFFVNGDEYKETAEKILEEKQPTTESETDQESTLEETDSEQTADIEQERPKIISLEAESSSALKVTFDKNVEFTSDHVEILRTDGSKMNHLHISVTGQGREYRINLGSSLVGQTIVVKISNVKDTTEYENAMLDYTKEISFEEESPSRRSGSGSGPGPDPKPVITDLKIKDWKEEGWSSTVTLAVYTQHTENVYVKYHSVPDDSLEPPNLKPEHIRDQFVDYEDLDPDYIHWYSMTNWKKVNVNANPSFFELELFTHYGRFYIWMVAESGERSSSNYKLSDIYRDEPQKPTP